MDLVGPFVVGQAGEVSWGARICLVVLLALLVGCATGLGLSWFRVTHSRKPWRALALPPRRDRVFGLVRRRIVKRRSSKVRRLFGRVRQSWWFSLKLRFAVFLLEWRRLLIGGGALPQRFLEYSASVGAELDRLLAGAEFCRLRAFPPVGGYASWRDASRTTAVTGIGEWVYYLPPIRGEAAGHELVHFVQQVCRGVFDQEWSTSRLPRWKVALYELHAHVVGSPGMFLSTIGIAFSPIVMVLSVVM